MRAGLRSGAGELAGRSTGFSSEEGDGVAGSLRALGLREAACGSRCFTGMGVRVLLSPVGGGERNPTSARHAWGEGGCEVRDLAGTLGLAHCQS